MLALYQRWEHVLPAAMERESVDIALLDLSAMFVLGLCPFYTVVDVCMNSSLRD